MRALDVQRAYLEWVRRRAGRSWMPPWAERVIVAWEAMLDNLEAGPRVSSRICDWAIKLMLFRRCLERRGISLEEAVRRTAHLARVSPGGPQPDAAVANRERAWLAPHRDALLELDFRFAALRDGLFGMVSKHLDTGVAEVDRASVLAATSTPPPDTRAALRGRMVRRFAGQEVPAIANWDRVIDPGRKRSMPIMSPFARSGRWREWSALDARFSGMDRESCERLMLIAEARAALGRGSPPATERAGDAEVPF